LRLLQKRPIFETGPLSCEKTFAENKPAVRHSGTAGFLYFANLRESSRIFANLRVSSG